MKDTKHELKLLSALSLKDVFFNNYEIYQELISNVFIAFFKAVDSYDKSMNASFKTYISSTTKNVIVRTYISDFAVKDCRICEFSLNEVDKTSGLNYEEIIGTYDYDMYECLFSNSVKDVMDNYDIDDLDNDFMSVDEIEEMLKEVFGEEDITRKEIVNLRRRVLYSKNKKVK